VEITYWQQKRTEDSMKKFEAIAERFMKDNPNIKVTIEEKPFSDIGSATETAIMAGEQPDIVRDSMMRIGKYAQNNLLASVDGLFTDPTQKFVDGCISLATVNGKLYGIPSTYGAYAVLINVDLFKKAGAENLLPKDPDRTWTREEFDAALAAVSKDGVYGTGLYAASEQSDLDTKTLIEGGSDFTLFANDGKTVRYGETRGVEGVAWLKGLIDKGLAYPGAETMIDDDCWALFAQQKIAVLPANTYLMQFVKEGVAKGEYKDFEMMAAQYPNVKGSTPKAPVNAIVYSIFDNKDPAKIEASKKFIAYIVDQEEETQVVQGSGEFSANKAHLDLYTDNAQLSWVASTLSKNAYNPGVAFKGFADVRFLLFPELQAVYTKAKTPEQAMKDFATAADAALKEANK
jgi:multiple sugar transport system substrate-binding protein